MVVLVLRMPAGSFGNGSCRNTQAAEHMLVVDGADGDGGDDGRSVAMFSRQLPSGRKMEAKFVNHVPMVSKQL